MQHLLLFLKSFLRQYSLSYIPHDCQNQCLSGKFHTTQAYFSIEDRAIIPTKLPFKDLFFPCRCGLGAGRDVTAALEEVSLAGARATALALVFSELLQNALEHGAGDVRIELSRRDGEVVLAIDDDGPGPAGSPAGTGLSIVRALVRDELQGTFDLRSNGRTRAEVVFPA